MKELLEIARQKQNTKVTVNRIIIIVILVAVVCSILIGIVAENPVVRTVEIAKFSNKSVRLDLYPPCGKNFCLIFAFPASAISPRGEGVMRLSQDSKRTIENKFKIDQQSESGNLLEGGKLRGLYLNLSKARGLLDLDSVFQFGKPVEIEVNLDNVPPEQASLWLCFVQKQKDSDNVIVKTTTP